MRLVKSCRSGKRPDLTDPRLPAVAAAIREYDLLKIFGFGAGGLWAAPASLVERLYLVLLAEGELEKERASEQERKIRSQEQ